MANMYNYNTSSAYKNYDFETMRRPAGDRLHTPERDKMEVRKEKRASNERATKSMANFLRVAFCFALAFIIVNGYVQINEAYNEIAALEKQYNETVAANQALQMKIDKQVNLEELQTVASEEYGMVRPERYQMFYVDMHQGDYAETVTEESESKKSVAVNGVTGTITGAMNIFK